METLEVDVRSVTDDFGGVAWYAYAGPGLIGSGKADSMSDAFVEVDRCIDDTDPPPNVVCRWVTR